MLSIVVHFCPRETIKTYNSHSPTETLAHQADEQDENMLPTKDRSCECESVNESVNQLAGEE